MPLTKAPLDQHHYAKLASQIKTFTCGPDPWQVEIAEYLTSGKILRDTLSRRTAWFYLNGPTLVGYAGLAISTIEWLPEIGLSKDCLEVNPLGVHADVHRQGVGTAIMDDLIEEAKDRAVSPLLFLWVHPNNTPAISLYWKMQFKERPNLPRLNPRNGVNYTAMSRVL